MLSQLNPSGPSRKDLGKGTQTFLSAGGLELSRVGLDKYGGRVDAAASTRSTPDVSAAILQAGLGRSYGGGRRESWCAGNG
jgi:hypothetical protein